MQRCAVALLAAFAVGCTVQDANTTNTPPQTVPEIEFLAPADSWPYPFSPAVRVGNMLYLSGQIGTRMENGTPVLVSGGIDPETRQTLDNIKAILEANRSSLQRVVRCLVMLADMSEWPRLNEIYTTYFPGRKPARSALGASGLALGTRVEIECTAVVNPE